MGDGAAVDALFETTATRFGRIDAVVNTAAAVAYGRFEDVPAEIYDRVITTNLLGTANVARGALRQPGSRVVGDMVLTGSLLGKIAVPFMSPYVTSKWGVHALTRMIQIEARDSLPGVHVTLISPGSVNTPAYSQAAQTTPRGRAGRHRRSIRREKVASAIVNSLSAPRSGTIGRDRQSPCGAGVPTAASGVRPCGWPADETGRHAPPADRRPRRERSPSNWNPKGEAEHGFWGRLGGRTVPTEAISPADDPSVLHGG